MDGWFFRQSPDPVISAFGAQLDVLYLAHSGHGDQTLSLGMGDLPGFRSIKKLLQKAIDNVFTGFAGLVEPNLFKATYRTLNKAIDAGLVKIEYKPDELFVQQLRKSGAWFAARKSYKQRQALAALLVNDAGNGKRPWKDFERLAHDVADMSGTRLKVEYNTAVASARNASRWKQYEDERDVYPNLEYTPSRAATPREEHKPYYGVIRPVDDDFWVHHYPPSAYNCLCGVKQSTGAVSELPAKQPKPEPGLDHNAGKTGELFSKTHPYSSDIDENTLRDIDHEGERLAKEDDGD